MPKLHIGSAVSVERGHLVLRRADSATLREGNVAIRASPKTPPLNFRS